MLRKLQMGVKKVTKWKFDRCAVDSNAGQVDEVEGRKQAVQE